MGIGLGFGAGLTGSGTAASIRSPGATTCAALAGRPLTLTRPRLIKPAHAVRERSSRLDKITSSRRPASSGRAANEIRSLIRLPEVLPRDGACATATGKL